MTAYFAVFCALLLILWFAVEIANLRYKHRLRRFPREQHPSFFSTPKRVNDE